MKILVHIGAHKTGSTFLQNIMRENEDRLKQDGVFFIDKKSPKASEALKSYTAALAKGGEGAGAKMREALEKCLKPGLSGYKSIVLSEENLLGEMQNAKKPFYPNLELAADAIEALKKFGTVSVFAAVRRQDTYLESCYLFRKVRENREYLRNIHDFLAKIDLDNMSWRQVLSPFRMRFGADHLRVRPFEMITEDSTNFARHFLGQFADPDTFKIRVKPSNPGMSRKAFKIISLIDESAIELEAGERYELGNAIHHIFRDPATYKKPLLLNEMVRRSIVQQHAAENRRLFEEYMPDLPADYYAWVPASHKH